MTEDHKALVETMSADERERLEALAVTALDAGGSLDGLLQQLYEQVFGKPFGDGTPAKVEPVTVAPITDYEKKALDRLPEVYGRVNVTEPRKLTGDELRALFDERNVIETLLKLLAPRKDTSIREMVATHFDLVAEEQGLTKEATATRDNRGHWAVKQEEVVPGTHETFTRTVSGGKPTISTASIEAAYRRGDISEEDYRAVTKEDRKRVYDVARATTAAKKDPGLMRRLLVAMAAGTPTTSISTGKQK